MKDLKLSGRKKRMEHFKSLHSRTGLNLVSLMDIFTILVFFLLVSSDSQQLPNSKDITLPTSIAKKSPKEALVIAITKTDILVQGKKVSNIFHVLNSDTEIIEELESELKYRATRQVFSSQVEKLSGYSITIMGDENISYQLLRKILTTCRKANFTRISFAALQKAKG